GQGLLIDALQIPRPQVAVNFDRRADHLLRRTLNRLAHVLQHRIWPPCQCCYSCPSASCPSGCPLGVFVLAAGGSFPHAQTPLGGGAPDLRDVGAGGVGGEDVVVAGKLGAQAVAELVFSLIDVEGVEDDAAVPGFAVGGRAGFVLIVLVR